MVRNSAIFDDVIMSVLFEHSVDRSSESATLCRLAVKLDREPHFSLVYAQNLLFYTKSPFAGDESPKDFGSIAA